MHSQPDRPSAIHQRPHGCSDEVVDAVGKLSESLETVERARGHLYEFHQLCGTADAKLGEAIEGIRSAGHPEIADTLQRELFGRNVLPGRWSFQVIEEYDDGYWSCFREHERHVRDTLLAGHRHVAESEMKERERSTTGDGPRPWHAARPETGT
ncbi:hypothetical protein [Haloactinomyces albus]|uniref:Uncharacterized protein n=1 Tax=Haloactinomyces albus TaxID=1352928 RepID=A0AAE3ZAH1_9ACTN|nr:hypothetical protein [Haloactinomyces albus]MDR7301292.1 hypothetical protein [Haloactinomyces albus]